ncbi:MAG: hypothetical protein GY816_05965 [Cytophagales bacterium]|nr:hypothetical protein [Cytophagales bacterium]
MKTFNNYRNQFVLIFLGLSFVFGNNLYAQSVQIEDATRDGFDGLRRIGDEGYYLQFATQWTDGMKKGSAKVRIIMMDNDLNITGDIWITTRAGGQVEDVAFNGGNFMVINSNLREAVRKLTIVDKEGNVVAEQTLEKVKRRLLSKPASILPVGDGDFMVINFIKEKKVGYSISRYNSKLEVQYTKEQIPDKKKLYPTDFFIDGDRLSVLEFITPDFSDYFEYHVASFDVNSGEQIFKQRVQKPGEKASGYATFIRNGGDGKVMTGGMFFDGQRVQESNSDGFFAAVIEKDGTTKFSFTDWKEVKAQLKDKGTGLLLGGKTKTFMHDIAVNSDGSFTLIGETYRKGDADMAGNKSTGAKLGKMAAKMAAAKGGESKDVDIAVTVSGFALMNFDIEGKFTSIERIIERPTITIIKNTTDPDDLPYVGQRKGLNVANILNNNGYFPYRFVAEKGDNKYIVSVASYKSVPMERLYFTKLNSAQLDTASVNVTSSDLQLLLDMKNKVMSKMGGLGKLAKKTQKVGGGEDKSEFELRGSHDPFDYRSKASNTRLVQSNISGKVLIYDFVPIVEEGEKQKGFFGQLSDTMRGSLKIQYIDLPN